jgi:murein DD-endopeptidase MepM/ murein hydrolase activator NlpD
MPVITESQARSYAQIAGFSGQSLNIIIAIAYAESGLNTSATNTAGNSAGVDRGILQINSAYHPEVSDVEAFNPGMAFIHGYRISQQGRNFTPWSAYNNGSYRRYLKSTPEITQTHVFPVVGYQGPVGLHWQSHKGASDIFGTPGAQIVAMTNGRVTITRSETSRTNGGGNTLTFIGDDGLQYHYAHLRDFPLVNVGSRVRTGQLIGYLGNSGIRDQSAHLHIGIGKTIIAGWGPEGGAGTDFDAVAFLRRLLGSSPDIGVGLPTAPQGGIGQITVYTGRNYTGESQILRGDYADLRTVGLNDKIRSIRIPEGVCVTLYSGFNFLGGETGIQRHCTSIPWIRKNDDEPTLPMAVSSLRIEGTAPGTPTGPPRFGLNLGTGALRIGYNINQTIAEVPGFAGICLALDQAEHFPGIITYEAGALDPGGIGAAMRSTGATIVANLIALSTRTVIFLIGWILFVGLIWNLVRATTGVSPAGIVTRGLVR